VPDEADNKVVKARESSMSQMSTVWGSDRDKVKFLQTLVNSDSSM
jgi:hypothetical protein